MSQAANIFLPENTGAFNPHCRDLGSNVIGRVRGQLTGSNSYESGGYNLELNGWFKGDNGLIAVYFDGSQGKYCPQYDYTNKKVKVIDTTTGSEVAAATNLSAFVFRYKAEGYL